MLCNALGILLAASEADLDAETMGLVAERDGARAGGDYPRADAIRRDLEARGWVVEDGPDGTRLHR